MLKKIRRDWWYLCDKVGKISSSSSKLKRRMLGFSMLHLFIVVTLRYLYPMFSPLLLGYILIVCMNVNFWTYSSIAKYPPKD